MIAARRVEILLVEDNIAYIRLMEEALKEGKVYNSLHVVRDGLAALAFLKREGEHGDAPRPDLILLDLNMPRMDGRELLEKIKADPDLKRIPVIVLTSSDAEQDILRSYDLHANSYINKPVDLDKFLNVIHTLDQYWLSVVKLPPS